MQEIKGGGSSRPRAEVRTRAGSPQLSPRPMADNLTLPFFSFLSPRRQSIAQAQQFAERLRRSATEALEHGTHTSRSSTRAAAAHPSAAQSRPHPSIGAALGADNQETRLRWLSEAPETRFRAKVRVSTNKQGYLSVHEDDLVTVLQQVRVSQRPNQTESEHVAHSLSRVATAPALTPHSPPRFCARTTMATPWR